MRKITIQELISVVIAAVIMSSIGTSIQYFIFHEQNWKGIGIMSFFTGLIVMYIVIILMPNRKKHNS